MNLGFILAYVFLVNILKNWISMLIRKKELQRFVPEGGGMGLVQERGRCKFPTGTLLEKEDS